MDRREIPEMKTQAVMGIDPGVRGGVAVLGEGKGIIFVSGLKPGMTQKAVVGIVRMAAEWLRVAGGSVCIIEKVGFKKGDGGKGANTFGRIDGLLRGAALSMSLDVHDVYPFFWQSMMNCSSGGNKNVTKKKAQELFPSVKITHAIADALLIARYGQLMLERKG